MYSFPLEEGEEIIKKGHANLYCDREAFNGALYLTNKRLVFIGYLLDITCKYMESVFLVHISEIICEKSLFIIPNALRLQTKNNKNLKFIVSGRNRWLTEINQQIKKL